MEDQGYRRDASDRGNENFGRGKKQSLSPEEFRKVYLFMYNLFQMVGFIYMLTILTLRWAIEGTESMVGSYTIVGGAAKFLHIMQILEILHPLLGYTRGSALYPGLQLLYKLFIIFAMIDGEPRMQTKPVVFYLFTVWTILEIVRYCYFMLHVFDVNVYLLTWFNYTLWIILNPAAFICEGVLLLRNVPYFDETQRYSISLPNWMNFSFSMPLFIRLILLVVIFPSFSLLMSRKYKKRVLVLRPKNWQKND
jgi:very-long-chain (3R)-3-hydroxyacyl-CoA dehydratase